MIRGLMVGLGGVGQRHARNLRAILGNDLDLIAYRVRGLDQVVTPQLSVDQTKTSIEAEYGIRSYGDLDEALAQKPDFAFICNPSGLHIPVAMACVEAGCDIFLEKPISASAEGVEKLTALAKEGGRIGMVGYQLRYHPSFLKLAEIVRSGALGNLLSVRATIGEYLPNWHPYEDYRTMYASRADLGGGVILSQIHEFDYLYALFGAPTSLYAVGGHWSHLEIDVEDTASILMHCTVDGRPLPVHVHQDYLQNPPSRECEVIGDRGKAVADFRNLRVTHFAPNVEPVVYDFAGFDRNSMFISETKHFLDCVKTRTKPMVDLMDGYQSLRMALAAKESIATDSLIRLAKADNE